MFIPPLLPGQIPLKPAFGGIPLPSLCENSSSSSGHAFRRAASRAISISLQRLQPLRPDQVGVFTRTPSAPARNCYTYIISCHDCTESIDSPRTGSRRPGLAALDLQFAREAGHGEG